MTLDVRGLKSAVSRLLDDAAEIQRIVAASAAESGQIGEGDQVTPTETIDLGLPAEIIVPRPDAVAEYLRAHPDLVAVVREMAAALVKEFRGEPSEIELALYQDPEIDERYLTYYVRVPEYDDSLMPRIRAVSEQVDSRYPPTPEWVLVTTDHRPMT
jgi:hypothetical protein